MTMTQPQKVGEHGRRAVGRITGGLADAVPENRLTFSVIVYRQGRPWSEQAGLSGGEIIALINREQAVCDTDRLHLSFSIRPHLPVISVSDHGPEFSDAPEPGAVKPLYDFGKTDEYVRAYFRSHGYSTPFRARHAEASGGGVQTLITADEENSVRWSLRHADWMRQKVSDLPGAVFVAPWGDRGVKVIWSGVA